MPMTTSEMTAVPAERRNDSLPSPFQIESSISDRSPLVQRRSRYQATPPIRPASSSEISRRGSEACRTPSSSGPALNPKARCSTLYRIHISRSPNNPAAIPVATSTIQNSGLSAVSPSLVTLGCSVAPRPDGSRVLISGCGMRRRSLGCCPRRQSADHI
jgi:hypothetical protein